MGAMRPGETPEQARARAQRLRDHADKARNLAGSLGSALDTGLSKASADGVWFGPYAERVTAALRDRRRSLDGMAQGLRATAQHWDHEADLLDQEAVAAGKGGE
ncbi:hypothetical protein [Streptomyces sp. PU-14G]|uniref:hypothetical protein n=1 Tax=Streptomyces sp. PU-14G TaxID=2800808 RepID=UPI0034DE27CC